MEREHLAAPVRHQERGLSLWVGLALGFAGIIVTIGGIYEWNARKTGRASVASAVDRLPGEDAEIVRLRRELAEAQAEAQRAQATAWRERVDRQMAEDSQNAENRPTRCIGGVRFEQFGKEWRNVGRC